MNIQDDKKLPLGVIGSIRSGFELVGRRLWLITLPVLLDLLLWLGPQVSLGPLMDRVTQMMRSQAMSNSLTADQAAQAIQALETIGEQLDLISLLSAVPLLNLPSLMAWRLSEAISPLGELTVWPVSNFGAMLGWIMLLAPIGLLLGFLYSNGLAHWVRDFRSPDDVDGKEKEKEKEDGRADSSHVVRTNTGKFLRTFLFAFGLLVIGGVLGGAWTVFVGILALLSPLLSIVVWMAGLGLGVYLGLHLVFVIPGLLVGERGLWQATWESFVLMKVQSPSIMGLIVLILVIYEGLSVIWSLPLLDSWSLLIGILGHSCVATGLTAATFIFYQERVGQLAELRQAIASMS